MEMAQTKIIILIAVVFASVSCGPVYRWQSVSMDGSRTGCVSASADNVSQALGLMNEDGSYVSPSGKVFNPETSVTKVASAVLEAQDKMASVKKVIAYSDEYMPNDVQECRLSNWFIEVLMNKVASLSGRHVDVGIGNFGGIRVGMPQGDVMLDDIQSMFPFRNNLVYLELSGRTLREIFSKMASSGKFEVLGGVDILASDGKIVSVKVGGHPLEDDRNYSVATISFLLHGGDGLTLADGAAGLEIYDVAIFDAVLEHVESLTSEGKHIKGKDVGHIVIR